MLRFRQQALVSLILCGIALVHPMGVLSGAGLHSGESDSRPFAPLACDPDQQQASGAIYRICMPIFPPWNGDLVVYAHGYVSPTEAVGIPEDQMRLPDGTPVW